MKITVCFRTTPDMEKVIESDWQEFGPDSNLTYAGRVLNCFDESALEIALRLKEAYVEQGQEVTLTALTVGEVPPASVWQTLYALGYDQVEVLETSGAEFVPEQVARLLADAMWEKGTQLIFTGRQSPMGDTATVPYLLAEALNIPVVPEVETVAPAGENLYVECTTDRGRVGLEVTAPAVFAVGNSPVAALRAATLRSKLQAAKRQVDCTPVAVKLQEQPVLVAETSEKQCRFWQNEDPAETVRQLTAYVKRGEEL